MTTKNTKNINNDNKDEPIKTNRKFRAIEYYNLQEPFDRLYADSIKGKNFNKLMELISSRNNLLLAYRNVKANKGSNTPGVDNKTIADYKHLHTEDLVRILQNKLRKYQPKEVKRVHIPKGNGKTRPLGIPTIEDRIIQQAIKQVLEPICEAKFHKYSFGFRPNRRAEHAIAYFMKLANRTGCHYVVDVDIKGFFDNVNHSKLLKQCWSLGIRDKNLLCVIKKCLTARINENGVVQTPTKGTPQGGILSPLLSNIVLNELDWWVSNQWQTKKTIRTYKQDASRFRVLKTSKLKQGYIVRYADDFKIMCKTREDAEKWYQAVTQWLRERLGLEVSPEKSKITNLRKQSSEFLGLRLKLVRKGNKLVINSRMTKKAKNNMVNDLRESYRNIQMNPIAKTVWLHNTKVLGRQQYYQMATHVNKDLNDIDFRLFRCSVSRLKKCGKSKGTPTETYEKFYGKYNWRKIYVDKIPLYPVGAWTHKVPQLFKQEITPYTEKGRELIHKNLECVDPSDLDYIVTHPIPNMSVEYNDNRVSLYTAQWGECGINNEPLIPSDMECHHKYPRCKGGDDSWKNLILVSSNAHKVIHATQKETIDKYLGRMYFRDYQHREKCIKKINKYRKLVGNDSIV